MAVLDYVAETTPPTLRFVLVKGDTLLQTLRITTPNYDFTGTTVRAQIKKQKTSAVPFVILTPIVAFPSLGIMTITLQTNYLNVVFKPTTYYADVELTLAGNIRKTAAFLEIQVVQDVTT